ncbi:MAG: RNA polymerase-binding protein RbpA [Nocardioidaceae bacterium]
MSERATLRGSRLGGTSFEDESGIEFAPRQSVAYDCPAGHEFEIPMSEEAEVPFTWECPRCGAESRQHDANQQDSQLDKPARTHWDMLLERRSITELENILSERLELLRSGSVGPAHLHRRSSKSKGTGKPSGKSTSKAKSTSTSKGKSKAKNSA